VGWGKGGCQLIGGLLCGCPCACNAVAVVGQLLLQLRLISMVCGSKVSSEAGVGCVLLSSELTFGPTSVVTCFPLPHQVEVVKCCSRFHLSFAVCVARVSGSLLLTRVDVRGCVALRLCRRPSPSLYDDAWTCLVTCLLAGLLACLLAGGLGACMVGSFLATVDTLTACTVLRCFICASSLPVLCLLVGANFESRVCGLRFEPDPIMLRVM
jgi:hypothetical protein